ncbi:MAG: hypothetical protein J7647_08710 [Cyanobacteria bacterium SBLK]|nr:hypothetical protein [Cyanobacteria bacterium SBLK]
MNANHLEIYRAISGIQNRCQFYNYELTQLTLPEDQTRSPSDTKYQIQAKEVKIINSARGDRVMAESSEFEFSGNVESVNIIKNTGDGNAKIIGNVEGDHIEGDKIDPSSEVTEALKQIKKLLQDLQQNQSEETLSPEIVEAEITALQQEDSDRTLMQWLDVAFAGGIETVKLIFPLAGIPIEVGLKLYEIWQNRQTSLDENRSQIR